MSFIKDFLHEKAHNMERWLREEGYAGQGLPLDVTPLVIVTMAQTLHNDHKDAIARRDFDALKANEHLSAVLTFVHTNPKTHDKFWRYLELFSDSVA